MVGSVNSPQDTTTLVEIVLHVTFECIDEVPTDSQSFDVPFELLSGRSLVNLL